MTKILESLLGPQWYLYLIGLLIFAVIAIFLKNKVDKINNEKWEQDPVLREQQLEKQIKVLYDDYNRKESQAGRERDDDKRRQLEADARKIKMKIEKKEKEKAYWAGKMPKGLE